MYVYTYMYIYIYIYVYIFSKVSSVFLVHSESSSKRKKKKYPMPTQWPQLRAPCSEYLDLFTCVTVNTILPPPKKNRPPSTGKKKAFVNRTRTRLHPLMPSLVCVAFFFWRESRSIFQSKCCLCVALFSVCMCPSLLGNHNCCGTQDTYIDRTRIYYVSICVLRIFYVYICVLCIYVFSHLYSVYSSSSQDTNISTIYVIWGGYN